ncbi:MAG: hypothetical protein XXXJIFNMEKO3_01362 [Candidatus Erwinia impunctatus]|nr:hypothetical protein XXXJIFNMEKO_01362 [Culicoides impunctatus]
MKGFLFLGLLFSSLSIAGLPTDFWRLRYDDRGIPLVDVQIASRLHTLMLDTGSGEGIHLYKPNLDQLISDPYLKAVRQVPRRLIDVSGGENEVSSWKIERLLISNIAFHDVEAVIFKPWGFSMGGEQPVNEVLGLGIFHGRRVMIDFKNDRLSVLKNLPSDISNWSAYPVNKTASGLRVTVSVGGVPLHLIVDTGASHSLLFHNRLPAGTLFSGCRTLESEASNLDCRVTKFTMADNKGRLRTDLAIVTNGITPQELDFDGLLGMGFMRGHQVIIDMPENMLYIDR